MSSIQLHIAEPCHENWNAMLPEEKGRFCLSCQKTVIDFTSMSDGQVFDYFKNYSGNTCGQFTTSQVDRQISKPKVHTIGRWKYFWQIFIPAFFAIHKADAQQTKNCQATIHTVIDKSAIKFQEPLLMGKISSPIYYQKGKVMDTKGNPVPFASVTTNQYGGVMTDSLGNFSIPLLAKLNDTAILSVSSIGFETKTIALNPLTAIETERAWKTRDLKKNITVTLEEYTQVTMGVVAYVVPKKIKKKNSKSEIKTVAKEKVLVQPIEVKESLHVFPNPISAGQDFQIRLSVKKAGNYIFKIANSSGNVVFEQRLNVSSTSYTTTIPGNGLQQVGVYFINIVNEKGGKEAGLTGKILVQ